MLQTFLADLNLLTVLVGADFKWYHKVFELDDSDWIDLRGSNYTSMNVKSEILSTVYLSFSVCFFLSFTISNIYLITVITVSQPEMLP